MNNNDLIIEDAHLIFRNFSGKGGRYNPEGHRNFCVFIDDPNVVKVLQDSGWNLKPIPPRDAGDEPRFYTQINVKYGRVPPKIVLITSRGKTLLDEKDINILDWAEIIKCDVIIRPFEWEPGRIKGYLKHLCVTIYEDPLDKKYADLPDAPDSAQSVTRDDSMSF